MKKYYTVIILLFATLLFSCEDSKETFDNKLYLQVSSKVNENVLKGSVDDMEKSLQASLANPEAEEVSITFGTPTNLVDTYNKAYGAEAIMLPADNYELSETKATINAGSTLSEEITVLFKNLSEIDRDEVYVLPVTIASANIEILESARTIYYVFKAGALINVVADIEENYLLIDWQNPSVANGLSQLTMEALIRARNFDKMISTVMGIEGQFLIRLGDAGFPSNQIQVATRSGNFPSGDSSKGLPTNEFVHIALTYDSSNGAMVLYVDGRVQGESTKHLGNINLGVGGKDGFNIGRSYADERYLTGDISEVRIWNIVRTPEEIQNNPYMVDPNSEGLVSYWKFDDEQSLIVKDHTGNNNNAVANGPLKWTKVKLPAPAK